MLPAFVTATVAPMVLCVTALQTMEAACQDASTVMAVRQAVCHRDVLQRAMLPPAA